MGQPITVTEKPTDTPAAVRLEINRSLTGMGHERYRSIEDCGGPRPPDVLARRLFERGGVEEVHIYSNVITVRVASDASTEGLKEIVEQLYTHYLPGVSPSIVT